MASEAHPVCLDSKYAILIKGAKDEVNVLVINPFEVSSNQFLKVAHQRYIPVFVRFPILSPFGIFEKPGDAVVQADLFCRCHACMLSASFAIHAEIWRDLLDFPARHTQSVERPFKDMCFMYRSGMAACRWRVIFVPSDLRIWLLFISFFAAYGLDNR